MIQILTATGARPEAWALCIRWMQNQDYAGPVRWIIVDDGLAPSEIRRVSNWHIEVLRPKPYWQLQQNTQARNIRAGLERVSDEEPLIIIEDDDHYKPGWLSRCVKELQDHDLIGQGLCRKYNLRSRRARELTHKRQASLCCTAMIGNATKVFRQVVKRAPRLMDVELWEKHQGHLFDGDCVTSIKCLPGRVGIDSGHKRNFGEIADPDGALLRRWIGADADHYKKFMS